MAMPTGARNEAATPRGASVESAVSAATTGVVLRSGMAMRRRGGPCSRPISGIGYRAARADIVHQVVHRDSRGEQVRQHADGVVLAPDEVARDHRAADETDDPEAAWDRRAAGAARGRRLDQPSGGEQHRANEADHLPRGHDDAKVVADYSAHHGTHLF